MKRLIWFSLSLATLSLSACGSKDVDLRDKYAGKYDVTVTTYQAAGSGPAGSVKASNSSGTAKLTVTKSEKPNVFLLSNETSSEVLTATLEPDAVITLEPLNQTVNAYNTTYTVKTNGQGRFIENEIKLTMTVTAQEIGMNQTVSVVGKKR